MVKKSCGAHVSHPLKSSLHRLDDLWKGAVRMRPSSLLKPANKGMEESKEPSDTRAEKGLGKKGS